jgi:hypothetical protein
MPDQPARTLRSPAPASPALGRPGPSGLLLSWRGAAGLAAVAAGAVMITGAFLPWVTTFAGLVAIPGVRGGNGRILAAAGLVAAAAGLCHALRGGQWSRWLAGLAGFAATGFSGFLHRLDGGRAQRPRALGVRRRVGARVRHLVPALLRPADLPPQ